MEKGVITKNVCLGCCDIFMDKEINTLIEHLVSNSSESETVEFKENNFKKEEIGKRISALANSANLHDKKKSYLVFGIKDKTYEIVGTNFEPENIKIGNEELELWLQKMLTPKIDFRIYSTLFKGEKLVIFEIPPAINQPVLFQNIAYIRIGTNTRPLQEFPEKERNIWNNINRITFEKGIAKEDLAASEVLNLLDYAKYFSLTKQELPSATDKFVEKMAQHGLVRKNFENSYDITNMGAILFGKDLRNFPTIKRKAVRITFYDGNSKINRKKESGEDLGYAISFESLLEYIYDKLPSNEEISQTLRKEVKMYPEIAIREFVANALIHQDLSLSGAGPTIEIFDNRIEITNTGKPIISIERFIDHPPRSRNEDLASFMRQIGVCEEGGTGIDRALGEIALYQLPAPIFEEYNDFTKVTMFAHKELNDMTTDDKVRACYQHCVLRWVEGQRMTNTTLRERLGIGEKNYPAASAIIREAKKRKVIKDSEKSKEYIPYWV